MVNMSIDPKYKKKDARDYLNKLSKPDDNGMDINYSWLKKKNERSFWWRLLDDFIPWAWYVIDKWIDITKNINKWIEDKDIKDLDSGKITDPEKIISINNTKRIRKEQEVKAKEDAKKKYMEIYEKKMTSLADAVNADIPHSTKKKLQKEMKDMVNNKNKIFWKEKISSNVSDVKVEDPKVESTKTDPVVTDDNKKETVVDSNKVEEKKWEPKITSTTSWGWKRTVVWWNTLPWKWNSPERQKLVQSFGIENYTWTAEQNLDLLNKMKWLSKWDLQERMETWVAGNIANQEKVDKSSDSYVSKEDPQWEIKWKDLKNDDIDDSELDLEEVPDEYTLDNIWEDADEPENKAQETLDRLEKERAEWIEKANEEKKRIAEEAANKESEEIASQQADTREAIEEQEAELERIKNSTEASDIQRRQELESNLQRSKNVAGRAANIAWAVAWQSWVSLPAWEMASITSDVLWSFDQNISAVEQALIKNKTELDKTLRASNLEILQKQENIDKWNEILDTKEWAPMLRYIQAAATWDQDAIAKVEEFHRKFLEKEAWFASDRAGIQERNKEQEAQYQAFTPDEKIDDLLWALASVPWIDKVNQSISWLLAEYPNDTSTQMKAKIKNLAAKAVDKTTNISTILQTDPTNWTAETKDIIKRTLWWFAEDEVITDPDATEEANRDIANLEEAKLTKDERRQSKIDEKNKERQAIIDRNEAKREEARNKKSEKNNKSKKYDDALNAVKEKLTIQYNKIKWLKESDPEKYAEEVTKIYKARDDAKIKLQKFKSTT